MLLLMSGAIAPAKDWSQVRDCRSEPGVASAGLKELGSGRRCEEVFYIYSFADVTRLRRCGVG